MPERFQSTVKTWYEPLRYGWLAALNEGGSDIHVDFSVLCYRPEVGVRLKVGEVVQFEIVAGRGRQPARAINLTFPATQS